MFVAYFISLSYTAYIYIYFKQTLKLNAFNSKFYGKIWQSARIQNEVNAKYIEKWQLNELKQFKGKKGKYT